MDMIIANNVKIIGNMMEKLVNQLNAIIIII
jgi:hypothetical protein